LLSISFIIALRLLISIRHSHPCVTHPTHPSFAITTFAIHFIAVKCCIREMSTRPRDHELHIVLPLRHLFDAIIACTPSISIHFDTTSLFETHATILSFRSPDSFALGSLQHCFDHLHTFIDILVSFQHHCILFWFPVATRHKHIVLFSIRIRIPFQFPLITRYHFALLLQRHKLPMHYSYLLRYLVLNAFGLRNR
jgi:hypothetical protein